ncbi:phytase [Thalassotalea ganghwensis]
MKTVNYLLVCLLVSALAGCENTHKQRLSISDVLTPSVETLPVNTEGDAADDPAIWINMQNTEQSLIIGTDKKLGLNVYNLAGELTQQLAIGRLNNVDLRYQISLAGEQVDIAAASNRSNNSISLLAINTEGQLTHLNDIKTNLNEVYGLCMYQNNDNNYVFINDKDGRYQQYQLHTEKLPISATLVREFSLPSQPEGCVADDKSQKLYMGEEAKGIWQLSADPKINDLNQVAELDNMLNADVEGVGLYYLNEQPYLVVSSQGTNSYVIYQLNDTIKALGHFRVATNQTHNVDEVSETDGLEVTSMSLGKDWPDGLLVVQDGYNQLPDAAQNFKLVSGTGIKQFIEKWTNAD